MSALDIRTRDELRRLTRKQEARPSLPDAANPTPVSGGTGLGQNPTVSGGGTGIASPLVETERTLHTTQMVSSDGLFVWSVPATITFMDADNRTVEFEFSAP